MDIEGMKKEYIGKKLLSIIDIDLGNDMVRATVNYPTLKDGASDDDRKATVH